MNGNVEKEVEKELVSVIIPTHNRADLICETLESIRKQSYKNIEVIVVDDHSKDGTMEAIKAYIKEKELDNIKVFTNRGKGACAARNMGIDNSKGSYIQFFDDDDLMFEDHIEKKVRAIKELGCDYSTCDYSFFDNETGGCLGHKVISNIGNNCASRLLTLSFPTPCFMCKRETIQSIGYWNEDIKKLQDMAYFHRLYLYDKIGFSVPDKLFNVRIHGGSMTSNNVSTPVGYYNQINALISIENEWKRSNKPERSTILKTIHFMKLTFCRNMYKKGFKRQGVKMLIKTLFGNIRKSLQIVLLFLKYKTVHITIALAADYDNK